MLGEWDQAVERSPVVADRTCSETADVAAVPSPDVAAVLSADVAVATVAAAVAETSSGLALHKLGQTPRFLRSFGQGSRTDCKCKRDLRAGTNSDCRKFAATDEQCLAASIGVVDPYAAVQHPDG